MRVGTPVTCLVLTLAHFASAKGQAYFEVVNKHTPVVDAPVFDAEGHRLEGPYYLAELWGGKSPDSLAPAALPWPGLPRAVASFYSGSGAGYFRGPPVVIPGVMGYDWAWLQVRAWDARLGARYEEVAALGIGGYGESPLFYAQGTDPADYKALPAPLIGLQSFRLRPVIPEPATWALMVAGASALAAVGRIRRACRSAQGTDTG